MNLNNIRKSFPFINESKIYFNHAAIGALSLPVLERIDEYLRERSLTNINNHDSYLRDSKSAKTRLARLLNTNAERLAWIENVGTAMSILTGGLNWEKGDRIILNDIEFPSNIYTFLNLEKKGVEIDIVKSENGMITFDKIAEKVTEKTRLLSISLVQFTSGFKADVDRIGEMCADNGIIFAVDAIQAAGEVEIDVQKSKIDFLAGGTQKWLMALQGLSYLFLTEALQEKLQPSIIGWASVKNDWDFLNYELEFKNSAERYQTGTKNAIGVAAIDQSLMMFESAGLENVYRNIKENTNYFIEKLCSAGFDPVLKNADEKNLSGIVSVKFDDPKSALKKLESMKIYAAMREGLIRFSPHFYNTKDEIERVVEALNQIPIR